MVAAAVVGVVCATKSNVHCLNGSLISATFQSTCVSY